MTSFPETELILKINGEVEFHIEPLDENGIGNVLVPGMTEPERLICLAMLADAMLCLTGCRPGPVPKMTVQAIDATGQPLPKRDKPAHLRLVDPEPKS